MVPLRVIDPPAGSPRYLYTLACGQLEPLVVIHPEPFLEAVLEAGGSAALSVPDPHRPWHVNWPLYLGATTPRNAREQPHFHLDQAEVYYVVEGEAEMWGKHHWDGDRWVVKTVRTGEMVVVQPGICHLFRWLSTGASDLALVFKNQRPGVGRFPAGKTTCDNGCPHYGNGCVLPAGYQVPRSRAA
jgi:mannose-6-phosphate isomerase-like protein (cupin superfamily)